MLVIGSTCTGMPKQMKSTRTTCMGRDVHTCMGREIHITTSYWVFVNELN